jgi:DNA replication initiation complex subunit (GINS family)
MFNWGACVSEINITYDLLFDVLRMEKSREDLQKLEDKFYKNVVEYLNSKESVISNPNTPNAERELTRIQLGNVKKLLIELYDRREKKIINLAIYRIKMNSSAINMDVLLNEEKHLFDIIYSKLSLYRLAVLGSILEGKFPMIEILEQEMRRDGQKSEGVPAKELNNSEDSESVKSIRFIKPVPRFLGPELEIYGPFEENDIASLPSKIANILLRKERAEEMQLN